MNILNQVKSLVKTIQKKGDLDQFKKALDLQANIIDLVEENNRLKNDIRLLEERLSEDVPLQADYEFYL